MQFFYQNNVDLKQCFNACVIVCAHCRLNYEYDGAVVYYVCIYNKV